MEVSMENMVYASHIRTKIVYLSVKWEEAITFFTILCAISAVGLGVIWLCLREMVLLYIAIGLSSFYFVGKRFWRFRDDLI
jgi:hypothetical protein